MDMLSVSSNLEYDTSSCGNFSVQKKLEGKKELRKALKASQKRIQEYDEVFVQQTNDITELKQSVKSLNEIISALNSQSSSETDVTNAASTKIIDLCKKNRQLKAELELTKSKYAKIDSKLVKIEKEIASENGSSKSLSNNLKSKKSSCCHIASSVDCIQDQLTSTKQKLFETLNLNTELKNNLKLAQKCLQQEIGETFNLNILAASNSNWRGRAQQILALQNKISELKDRLECNNSASNFITDDPCKNQIRKIEANRKADLEDLQQQMHQMQSVVDQQNMKISALKARNKNLVDDAMNYKLKTLNLMELSDVSDNSIAAINEKLNIQKYHYEHQIKEFLKQISEFDLIQNDLILEHSRTKMELEKTNKLLDNKQETIEELNNVITRLENDLKSICGDFLFSCRNLKKTEFLAILDSLETEKNGVMKLNEELNRRLETDNEKIKSQTELISKQKIKISRLEGKIRDHNKEQETQHEKKKRNQRITEYSNSLSGRLSVSGMIYENSNFSLDSPDGFNSQNDLQIDDLKHKIEFLNEKIEYLEDKMEITKKEKGEDFKLFNEVMKNSKTILLNMIQQSKLNKEFSTDGIEYNPNSNTKNDFESFNETTMLSSSRTNSEIQTPNIAEI